MVAVSHKTIGFFPCFFRSNNKYSRCYNDTYCSTNDTYYFN